MAPKVASSKNAKTNRGAKPVTHNGRDVVVVKYVDIDGSVTHVAAFKDQIVSGKESGVFVRTDDGALVPWSDVTMQQMNLESKAAVTTKV